MPIESPFHERTFPLCTSYRWKDWAGFAAVASFDHSHEPEYFAYRESAGLMDVTPLYKYEVRGPDAARFLSRVMVRNISKLRVGRVTYCCWCDDDGKVIDDGTITHLDESWFRVTAAEPTLEWLQTCSRRFDVEIEDSTHRVAALALQGPRSRDILVDCCDGDVAGLKFFRAMRTRIAGFDVEITRTGYTGDLGYEVWTARENALPLWDALMEAGRAHALRPAALDALDVARIEAGFIMLGVDYYSSRHVVLESRKSTPFEIGLGWAVQLDRDPFLGQAALRREKEKGSEWRLVGLRASWEELEQLYDRIGLPPNLPARASREPLPVYCDGQQVGRATSHTWSPILKQSIALASVRTPWAAPGTELRLEHTVEFERQDVAATVVETPFFDPLRKRKP